MVKINFYFIRHGYSCANLKKSKKRLLEQINMNDPHLCNWGILGSIISGLMIRNILKKIKFKYYFCSPLIRTWETALCVFSSNKKIQINVGPHLIEFISKKYSNFIFTSDNTPKSFNENQKRLLKFKKHYHKLYKQYCKIDTNSDIKKLKNKFNNMSNVHIKFHKKKYSSKYTDPGDLKEFMKWYLKKFKPTKDQNIAIVSHSHVILNFVKTQNIEMYKYIKNLGSNNFTIKVEVIDKKINDIKLIFEGIKYPNKEELKKIRTTCSICKTAFSLKNKSCDGNNELIDYNVHNNMLKKYIE